MQVVFSPWHKQTGFTLIEVLIGGALSLLVIGGVMVLAHFAVGVIESMEASVRLNQEMRLVADMLRDGSESRIVPTVPLIVPT
ncbi:MAG: hypothetical protein G8345_15635, partial [Magnetococcales bacterium]|nr:hypothetical protein [Magnetococcales bacterium]